MDGFLYGWRFSDALFRFCRLRLRGSGALQYKPLGSSAVDPRSRKRLTEWGILLFAVLVTGCTPAQKPQPVDLSKPQSAALEYVKALQRGDAVTARTTATGPDEDMHWVDALASLIDGLRTLNNVLYDRFGRTSSQLHADMEYTLRILADDPVDLISNGGIRSNATEAVIEPDRRGFYSKDQVAIAVTKVKDRELWKVDLERTYVPSPPREQLMMMSEQQKRDFAKDQRHAISQGMSKYQRLADVFHAVAKDVRKNRYKTMKEVEDALGKRIRDLMPDFAAH